MTHRTGSTSPTTGDIEGVIRFAKGNEPASGLTVVLGKETVITAEGRFRFTALPPGTYTVHIYAVDERRDFTVVVRAGMTTSSTIGNFPELPPERIEMRASR